MTLRAMFDNPVLKLEIVICLAWVRLLLTVLPFSRLRRSLGPVFEPTAAEDGPDLTPAQLTKVRHIRRIIPRVARRMPFRADCVPQAMTGRWVLARCGIPSRILFGTRRDPAGRDLQFHAWLKVGDIEVTGGHENGSFLPFDKDGTAAD